MATRLDVFPSVSLRKYGFVRQRGSARRNTRKPLLLCNGENVNKSRQQETKRNVVCFFFL